MQGDLERIYVAPYDNHLVHLSCHNTFRKTLEYEDLPNDLRKAFDDHCEWHEDEAQAQIAEMGQQEELLNAPAPPPAPMMPPVEGMPAPELLQEPPLEGTAVGGDSVLYPAQQPSIDTFALGMGNTAPIEQM